MQQRRGCLCDHGPSRGAGYTTPGMTSSLASTSTSTEPTREREADTLTLLKVEPGEILQIDHQPAARLALNKTMIVMHPAIVGAQIAAADQNERGRRRSEELLFHCR